MHNSEMIVTRDWAASVGNPKSAVLERRLRKARENLTLWTREIDMVVRLVERQAGPGASVLDVACGTGFTMLELANRGFRTAGLDADPALCQLANVAAARFGLSARGTAGDACRLPFSGGSFDAVMSRSFFEHVYDRELAVSEQLRVLRLGAMLLISDGHLLNLRVLFDLLFAYPLRMKGKHGGLRWIAGKRRVHKNLYGYLPLGRDEDIKTLRWWRRFFARRSDCEIVEVGTSAREMHPGLPAVFRPFLGSCQVISVKR